MTSFWAAGAVAEIAEYITATLGVQLDAAACRALRSHRIWRGLGQKEIAWRAGITQSALSAFERGARPPPPEVAYRWIVALGLRRRILLGDDELEVQHAGRKPLNGHR